MAILVVIGTRPELIKLAPVIYSLQKKKLPYVLLNTAQHKSLLDPYWKVFGIKPDAQLDVMVPGQSLSALTSRVISQLQEYIDSCDFKISAIMAQGDTTTVMAASMVSFYNAIPFAHVEAGLRSYDYLNPFPEEFNRRVASLITSFHFAPTKMSANQLKKEGIKTSAIHLVGNTVVDSLQHISKTETFKRKEYSNQALNVLADKKFVLITCHRRENHGTNFNKITASIQKLLIAHPKLTFLWILHPNPNIKIGLEASSITSYENFMLVDPVEYWDLLKLIRNSSIIITDSGGIQEEAPSFGKPVLVMREVTERPEAVKKGFSKLVGVSQKKILEGFNWASSVKLKKGSNPYGDGKASDKIAAILKRQLF